MTFALSKFEACTSLLCTRLNFIFSVDCYTAILLSMQNIRQCFLKISVHTTSDFKAAYLWNGSSYCSDSSFTLILVSCTLATLHKPEIALLSDKGPFLTYLCDHPGLIDSTDF